MAEMTAAQAIEILNASPDLDKEVLESPFFVLYVRMKIDKARAISALIQRQAIDIERAKEYIGKANSDIDELRTGLEQQAQEIERLNKSLQFEQNYLSRVGTHGPDCYKWGPGHWDCAIREVERLCDLHRSILWFCDEHKKLPNCKKWIPLIEEKARQGVEKEAEGVE